MYPPEKGAQNSSQQGKWAIVVSRNWRITFEFFDGDASIVNYEVITDANAQSPHPGEFIREVYLEPLQVSHWQVAIKLKVSPSTFTRLINGLSNVSPEMALRLSKTLGRTPESWMAMQSNYDLWHARQAVDLNEVEKLALP